MEKVFKLCERMIAPYGTPVGYDGYATGTRGVAGVASKLNKMAGQQARAGYAALAMSKVGNGGLKVAAGNGHEIAFVEYESETTGEVTSFIVGLDSQKKAFNVKADSDDDSGVVPAVFAAVAYSDEISNRMQQDDPNVADGIQEIRDAASVGFASDNDMLVACDAFYYVAKDYEVELETGSTVFTEQKKRLEQGNFLKEADGVQFPDSVSLKKKKGATKKKSKATIYDEPLDAFKKRCMDGYFVLDIDWASRLKPSLVATIKPLKWLERYVPTEEFRETLISVWKQVKRIKEQMDAGADDDEALSEPVNVQMMGKPGTGKTTLVEAVLCAMGYPHGFINCKGRSEEDEIEGMNKFVRGRIEMIPTKLVEFWNHGGAVVLEEMNLPDPDILQGALGQALVYPYVLKCFGYVEIKRDPLMLVFGTMNVGTNGTKPLNQGLKSRFDEGYILEDVDDAEFKNILYSTGYDKDDCDFVFKAYKAALAYLTDNGNDDFVLSITMRGCKKAVQKLANGFSKKQAIRTAFVSQIYSEDPDVAKDLEAHLEMVV